jgi:hypothetical protein
MGYGDNNDSLSFFFNEGTADEPQYVPMPPKTTFPQFDKSGSVRLWIEVRDK